MDTAEDELRSKAKTLAVSKPVSSLLYCMFLNIFLYPSDKNTPNRKVVLPVWGFFDTLPEVKEAPKTSNSYSSAYMDTAEDELRSKAKTLAVSKPVSSLLYCMFLNIFLYPSDKNTPNRKVVLPVWGFFDTLPEVKEAPKTSNSYSSAYMDTAEDELRSKAKTLAVLKPVSSLLYCVLLNIGFYL